MEIFESINPWEGEVSISSIWIFLLMTMTTIINLPLAVYYTFVLEEKYGFNKQTARFFIVDKIKAFVLNQVIVLPMSALTIVIVKYGGDLFFVWLWMVIGIFMLILLTIYPSYIAPLFDKYTPLPEAQLYVVEGSKRSAHSNAYFYGLFKSKRIVLFDTLLKNPDSGGCKNDEILAVLSHELGHWSHGHIIKNLIIMQVNLFFIFAAFSFLFKFSPLYQAVGFPVGVEPVLVGLMVVMQYVMMPYNALLSFILTCLSRKFEFQADEFAMKLGRAEPLKRALIQLNKDNLGFPIYDTLYSMWHHSHPPLLERIAALKPKKD
ncbi:caax prenyl protease 1 [Holotrichia oblita]|uniref:Caax prenyl protease 1 n=1 Tax=Holotrichia oblita TaxID=644536 RepID=A0ACB9SRS0_HOLOL|nr:caax prenyl protease 1 [Holotrichia oblita]